jgi:RNA polymerase sigma-70 factor (ECF subfamily)
VSANRDRFVDVYDEHIWDVYGFLAYRTASSELAEDLTQTTFERALRAWNRFDPDRASPRTWLLSIAHNALVDHYRRFRAEPAEQSHLEQLVDQAGSDGGPEASLGPSPELERALEILDERARHVIALRFGGDLSGAEIAELTGLSLANVQQILSRSLRALHAELDAAQTQRADLG